jgi:2,3-dihydroxy-p-cumate/2,3-dihydroxybenzoate 3,4-dioxygenase
MLSKPIKSVSTLCGGAPEESEDILLPRYSKLGYVVLNVSDVERSTRFYRDIWGLQESGTAADGSRFLTCSSDHHNLILCKGEPGLKRVGWQLESELEFERLTGALSANGLTFAEVSYAECASLGQGRSIRFVDSYTGATHEYYVEMVQSQKTWTPTVANIQRLGHLVLRAPKFEEAVRFYTEVLNFKLSDRIGDRVAFMRCFPNRFHHSIGLSNLRGFGIHHFNFMVSEIDDIGKAIWRCNKNDVPIVRGPGRHPPSDSVFFYVLDPDGITVEYSFEMEEFPEHGARPARELPFGPESIDYWGGPTDRRLGQVGTVE